MSNSDHYLQKTFSISISDGYVYIEDLLKHDSFKNVSYETIKEIVDKNNKKRFALETEKNGKVKIKACQGHSIEVD